MMNTEVLVRYGWNPYFASRFEPFARDGLTPCRVIREDRGYYLVQSAAGELLAEVSGRFMFQVESLPDYPAVGDWVAAVPLLSENKAIIQAVLERKNRFSRSVAGTRTEEQVASANVDCAFIVTGLDADFNLRRIERYLFLSEECGVESVIVLNKSDICNRTQSLMEETIRIADDLPVYTVSAKENQGIDLLKRHIKPGQTAVFLGSSGAGKSSIINRLMGSTCQYVNEIRHRDGRGQHTTTTRELLLMPGGGIIIDNPGMREIKLVSSDLASNRTFQDLENLAMRCRFRNCRHENEPGCAIQAAIQAGSLDPGRLVNFRKLQKEIQFLEQRKSYQERQAQKSFSKMVRGHSRRMKPE